MMMFIGGHPRPQPRQRGTVRGKFVHMYTPNTGVKEWKQAILLGWVASGSRKFEMPVVKLVFFYAHKTKAGYRTSKPDVDNLAKAVLDALNGHAYGDDSSVVRLIVEKRYGQSSGVHIEINEADDPGIMEN